MKKLLSVILAVVTTISFATGCAKLTEIKEMAEESDFAGLVSVGQDIGQQKNRRCTVRVCRCNLHSKIKN